MTASRMPLPVLLFARRSLATFRSPMPNVPVPNKPYQRHVLSRSQEFADKVALVCADSGKRFTYAQMAEGTRNVASGLARLGMRHKDVLCIFSQNCVEYPLAMYGVMDAGGVVTTVNPEYTTAEVANQMRDCRSRFLLTSMAKLDVATRAAKESGVVKEIIVMDGRVDGFRSFADLLEDDGSCHPEGSFEFKETDLAAILYSSGTTGLPKGVMLTHRNITSNVEMAISMAKDGQQHRLLGVLPFFHVYGQVPVLAFTFLNGFRNVVMGKFDPLKYFEVLQEHRLSLIHVVPPIVLFMLAFPHASKFDLSALKIVVSAAAPLGKKTEAAFLAKFPHIDIGQGWGLTETSPAGAMVPPRSSPLRKDKPGSAGLLLPNLEMRVVDPESGRELGPNETGEFHVRGDCVMAGYYGNKEATDECISPDGWFRTGDIGHIDEDNYMFVSDRLKELIKVKGLQVAPAELEALLLECPQVADAGVVARPDERAGELPVAFVVAKKDSGASETSVYNWVAERVAPHKKLDGGVRFVDAIPKAASGKILRRKLRDLL